TGSEPDQAIPGAAGDRAGDAGFHQGFHRRAGRSRLRDQWQRGKYRRPAPAYGAGAPAGGNQFHRHRSARRADRHRRRLCARSRGAPGQEHRSQQVHFVDTTHQIPPPPSRAGQSHLARLLPFSPLSFPRKRESSAPKPVTRPWIPASAGMTATERPENPRAIAFGETVAFLSAVIPAEAGIQPPKPVTRPWIPASAGMTATERSENPNAIALPTAAGIRGCPTVPVPILADYFSIVDN